MRHRIYFFALILVSAFSACKGGKSDQAAAPTNKDTLVRPQAAVVDATGRIEPEAGLTDLSSDISGLIRQVLVKEGQTVKKGEPLLILDNTVPGAQVSEAEARLKSQEQELTQAQIRIRDAQNDLQKAQVDFERTKRLADRNAETKEALDNATNEQERKTIALANQEAALKLAQQKVLEIRAQLVTARESSGKYIVRAPQDGLILLVTARAGATIGPGNSFAQLAPTGRLTALCEVDELYAEQIKVGQKAWVTYRGYPDTVSTGSVIYTAPYLKRKSLFSDQVGEKEDRRVREVRILLEKQDLLINRQVEGHVITR
jgi:HlyD family secretion protein